jgi:hypothetical protein
MLYRSRFNDDDDDNNNNNSAKLRLSFYKDIDQECLRIGRRRKYVWDCKMGLIDHVDEARRLRTATTNGPIVHPPGDK